MTKKQHIFPATILEIVVLFIVAMFLALPFFILDNLYLQLPEQLKIMLFSFLYFFIIYILSYYYNVKVVRNKEATKLNFKLDKFLFPFSISFISFLIVISIPLVFYSNYLYSEKIVQSTEMTKPLYWISVVLLAPLSEEIIFRSIILRGLLTKYAPKVAILISAIIFGLVHFYFVKVIFTFFFGLFLGHIYHKTKSVGMTIVLHMIANLVGLCMSYIHTTYGDKMFTSIYDLYGSYTLIILVSFTIVGIIFIKKSIKSLLS